MDLRAETIELLAHTMRRLRRTYDLKAAQHGLTLSRVRVLRHLEDHEGVTQVQLAAQLQIEAPTLKRQIDALVAAGLVERGTVPGGGRGKGLYLTDVARRHAYAKFSREARIRLLAGVSDSDLVAFNKVFQQIGKNIEELDQE